MEMTLQSDLCPTKRHMRMLEGDSLPAAPKFTKRRRRDHSLVAVKEQQQGEVQLPQADQFGTNTTAATTTVKRSSRFRGVSRHRWTGRYEAHLWDKGSWNPTQRKKGKQVYLGAYDEEESAARAYDLAALKYWGTSTFTNFPVPDYEKEIDIMKSLTKEEYLASLRRRSSGFSRGVSKYRGVARHHHNGRWEARIGRVFGNKYLYLGTYGTQEEAAHAYDIAAIEYRGINAVTNFDLSTYIRWLRPVSNSLAAQEQKPATSTISPPLTTSPYLIPTNAKPDSSNFNLCPFTLEYLDTLKPQEIFQRRTPISPCSNSSSPTALGLLLKSSVFRELVEKNLCPMSYENDGNDIKNLPEMKNDHFDMLSYDSIGNINCTSSSNSCALPGLESREENALPLCNERGQSLWNLPFNSSSSLIFS